MQLALDTQSYTEAFRRLYYHMYSNSNASRAERIITDISKVILLALLETRGRTNGIVDAFLQGKADLNNDIFPILQAEFPNLITDEDKFSLDQASLREGITAIRNLDLRHAPAHLLGDAFQALMGPRLRGDKGQFFTPKSVVRAIVSIVGPEGGSKVVDPACGTGGFLSETFAYWNSNKKTPGTLIGFDKDNDLCFLSSALLEATAPQHAHIYNVNSLDKTKLRQNNNQDVFDADVVVTNPPFGARIPVKDPEILSQYSLGYEWASSGRSWVQTEKLRSGQDPQILFIELCVDLLRDGGKMGIVLPEGVFGNHTYGYVWDFLAARGRPYALLDCPRTTFQPGTDTKTNILFFEKGASASRATEAWISVALTCGHDRRGRTTTGDGSPYPDDFVRIAEDWDKGSGQLWSLATIDRPYYWVPRYYDKKTHEKLEEDGRYFGTNLMSLQDMIDKGWIRVSKGHEVGAEAYGTGSIPFIRTSDVTNFEVSIDPTNGVSEAIYKKYKDIQNLKEKDILLVVDGRYKIGRCAMLNSGNVQSILQSHFRKLTVTEVAPFEPEDLLYMLSRESVQLEMRRLVFIQSTLGGLGKRLHEVAMPVPPSEDASFPGLRAFKDAVRSRAAALTKMQEIASQDVDL